MRGKSAVSRTIIVISIAIIFVALVLGGGIYYFLVPSQNGAEPIKIGFPAPLSGYLARDGEEQRRGLLVAVDEINKAGGLLGRPVEVVMTDVGNYEPEQVISGFEYLFAQGIDALITGYPGIGLEQGEYSLLVREGIPYTHGNTLKSHQDYCIEHPDETWNIFQMDQASDTYAINFVQMLNTLIENEEISPSNQKVAIISSEAVLYIQLGEWISELLEEQGWEISLFETTPMGTIEWGPTLLKIRNIDPAAVLFLSYVVSDSAAFVTQFRENPTNSLLYVHYTPGVPEFGELVPREVSEGVVWALNCGLLPNEKGAKFIEMYQEMFGLTEYPSYWSAPHMYDSFWVWAEAVKEVGDSKDYRAVCEAMENTDYNGVMGLFEFDKKRHEVMGYPVDAKMNYEVGDPTWRGRGLPMQNFQIRDGENHLFLYESWSQEEADNLGIPPELLWNTEDFELPPWMS